LGILAEVDPEAAATLGHHLVSRQLIVGDLGMRGISHEYSFFHVARDYVPVDASSRSIEEHDPAEALSEIVFFWIVAFAFVWRMTPLSALPEIVFSLRTTWEVSPRLTP
jgi:hypothetical protein